MNTVEAHVAGGLDSEGPGLQLRLQFIELLSGFPVKFNLRRYSEASACVAKDAHAAGAARPSFARPYSPPRW